MDKVKEDAMNGAAYEDNAAVEWRIVTDVDRFCGANIFLLRICGPSRRM